MMKIIEIIVTWCQILRLKRHRFDFGWGFAPDPARGARSAPHTPADPIPAPGLETICLHKYVSLNPPMMTMMIEFLGQVFGELSGERPGRNVRCFSSSLCKFHNWPRRLVQPQHTWYLCHWEVLQGFETSGFVTDSIEAVSEFCISDTYTCTPSSYAVRSRQPIVFFSMSVCPCVSRRGFTLGRWGGQLPLQTWALPPPQFSATAAVYSTKTCKQLYTGRFWRVGVVPLVIRPVFWERRLKKCCQLFCIAPQYFPLEPPLCVSKKSKQVDIHISALLYKPSISDMGSCSFTHEPYLPLLLSHKASPPFGWYSLHLPTKGWPGWVDMGGWSHTEINVWHRYMSVSVWK